MPFLAGTVLVVLVQTQAQLPEQFERAPRLAARSSTKLQCLYIFVSIICLVWISILCGTISSRASCFWSCSMLLKHAVVQAHRLKCLALRLRLLLLGSIDMVCLLAKARPLFFLLPFCLLENMLLALEDCCAITYD